MVHVVLRFRVDGDSMAPALRAGQEITVRSGGMPVPGDVVVVRHPFRRDVTLVKRVVEVRDGMYRLAGDNPAESTDSRHFGAVPRELIVGRVT